MHRSVDDAPFGGGAGMVMMPEPIFAAVEAVQPPRPLLLLSASGPRFDQARARELAAGGGFSLLCGRYEGVDQRVADHCCDGELSIGDYVLAGGEAAALLVIEAVTRLVPGVMGNEASSAEESFGPGEPLLEYPQYTRPGAVPGLGRARGAAVGRPRAGGALAAGRGAAPDPRPPTRPAFRSAHRGGGTPLRRVPDRRGRPLASRALPSLLRSLSP